jgi:hypothetical protein
MNQHPVISTVLWMLGTSLSTLDTANTVGTQNKNIQNRTRSQSGNEADEVINRGLSSSRDKSTRWKDQFGGNINEYIHHIQPESAAGTRSRATTLEASSVSSDKINFSLGSKDGEHPSSYHLLQQQLHRQQHLHQNGKSEESNEKSLSGVPTSNPENVDTELVFRSDRPLDPHYPPLPVSSRSSEQQQQPEPTASTSTDAEDAESSFMDHYTSPQWGFYVPITPPQQEMFIKQEKVKIHTTLQGKRTVVN